MDGQELANSSYGAGQVVGRQPPGAGSARKVTAADSVRDQSERAIARLSATRCRLQDLHARVTGQSLASDSSGGSLARDVASSAGFMPGTLQALEQVHTEITGIDDLLAQLSEYI